MAKLMANDVSQIRYMLAISRFISKIQLTYISVPGVNMCQCANVIRAFLQNRGFFLVKLPHIKIT